MIRTEADLEPGDVYETLNGNRYLVIDGQRDAYIGNRDPTRNDLGTLQKRRLESKIPVKKIGKLDL